MPGRFQGDCKKNTKVVSILSMGVHARYVRFVVETWKGGISMRADVIACDRKSDHTIVFS